MGMPPATGVSRPRGPSRGARRSEWVARAVLWTASGVTIGVLLIIIGYILYRGFVSDIRAAYPVLPHARISFAPDPYAHSSDASGLTVIVHPGVRTEDLTLEQVGSLFGGERGDWEITGQDLEVVVFTRPAADPVSAAFACSVARAGAGGSFRGGEARDDAEMIRAVSSTPGGIGYVESADEEGLRRRGVKPIGIRRISLVANPAVMEVKANKRLISLTEAQARELLSGNAGDWSALGGIDLPVTLFRFPESTAIGNEAAAFSSAAEQMDSGRTVASVAELASGLRTTPGSVGYCDWRDAADLESAGTARILPVERREVSRNLTLSFILEEPKKSGKVGGVSTIILNTLFMVALTLLFATPLGIGAALYLAEYARQGRLVRILRYSTETLAGIPSIIFGLFGYILFVSILKMGIGLLSGTLTLTIMILPTLIRTAEEAFKAVPPEYRAGSLALGATKWQTMTRVVIPAATPGILTGVILGIGRAVGETAALLFTMGSSYRLAQGFSSSARVLSVHLYILAKEGISFERAFATGAILMFVILLINYAAAKLIGRMNSLRSGGGAAGGKGRMK